MLTTENVPSLLPAFKRIEADLRERIEQGRWKPGLMIPSRRSLALEFGVDLMTLQRAIAALVDDGLLRPEDRRGTFVADHVRTVPPLSKPWSNARSVRDWHPAATAAQESDLGHVQAIPTHGALNLSKPADVHNVFDKPLRFIVLASLTPYRELPTSHEIWSRRASSSLERYVQALGHVTHSVNLMDRPPDDAANEVEAAVCDRGADVIAYLEDGSHTPAGEALLLKRLALLMQRLGPAAPVLVRARLGSSRQMAVDTVTFDNAHGAYQATMYMRKLGHQDILYLACDKATVASSIIWTDRIAAFYRALYESGDEWSGPEKDPGNLDAWDRVVFADPVQSGQEMWFETGRSAWRNLVDTRDVPEAIIACNDHTACAIVEAARAAGYDIPGRLSVIGYDDRESGAAINLTTVHVPVEEIGIAAAKLAIQRLANPQPNARTEVVLMPTLVVRGTTKQRE